MKDIKDIKSQALNFLIGCYFGQSEDLLMAAIDRAYVDMASHTMKLFSEENYKEKWKCRYNASYEIYNAIKKYPDDLPTYESWHAQLIDKIKNCYPNIETNENLSIPNNEKMLTEGQAQKWLNMTVKYMFVFKMLLGEEDKRLFKFDGFLKVTYKDLLPPVDSYLLKEIKYQRTDWSNFNEEYPKVLNVISNYIKNQNCDCVFEWELFEWEKMKNKNPQIDSKSYAHYKQKHKKG